MIDKQKVMIGGGNSSSSQIVIKERTSNLELYRIIVMLLIVAHHYVISGSGLTDIMYDNPFSPYTVFYRIMGAWGKTGINCFVLITGYFMCRSNISLRKFLKLALEVVFYNVIIYFVFCLCGYTDFSSLKFLYTLIPIKSVDTGFTSAFLLFYLLLPSLNAVIKGISQNQHRHVIALMLLIYTVFPMLLVPVSYNYVTWFSILYLIASYIRIYGLPHNDSAKFWGFFALISLLLSIVSIIAPLLIHKGCTYFFVSDSNHVMALITAVSSFMFFKNVQIKNKKWINSIAATTFGVFLIHTRSDEMRTFLWRDLLDAPGHYSYPLFALLSVFLVFIVCSLIDAIRIKIIETPLLNAAEKACYWVKAKFEKK